jgi:hypothetical protein
VAAVPSGLSPTPLIIKKNNNTVLFARNADGSDKLPPLVTEKYRSPHCFKNVRRLPTKYEANINSWITTKIFLNYLTQRDIKLGAKILLSLITVLPI